MKILICDDSGMARKQMARALPSGLAKDVSFAEHGAQAMSLLRESAFDILFLDLTMPVMDGYETLEAIRNEAIAVRVIVVSGDIQDEAQERTLGLGAAAFCQKPVSPDIIQEHLDRFRLLDAPSTGSTRLEETAFSEDTSASENISAEEDISAGEDISAEECLREISNIAMGEAAANLAKLLKIFINLPIPKVATLQGGDLPMTLHSVGGENMLAVSQGFVFNGLAGEAVLSTDFAGIASLQQLMVELEASSNSGAAPLLDAATILIGAFLTSFGKTLDLNFCKSSPIVLTSELIDSSPYLENPPDTLAIEIPYHFEAQDIVCDLLLLFPGKTGKSVLERSALLN